MIYGNVIGGTSGASVGQTIILVDESGKEVPAVLVEEEVDLTATPNDIRIGTVAVTEAGVTTGTKEIPSYNTREGIKVVTSGKQLSITTADYDYTKMQALICAFNTSLSNSVSTEKVAIDNLVYDVLSVVALSSVTKNDATKAIDFGVTNESGAPQIIRYIYFKEVY